MAASGDRVLFLDCASGASGDMLAASLLALAARAADHAPTLVLAEVVQPALRAVGVADGVATVSETRSVSFTAWTFAVADAPGFATFGELIAAVRDAPLNEGVKATVVAAAQRMEAAEREAHGEGGDGHLHELAGIDTVVDLVAVAALVDHLAPIRVAASPPALGGGTVTTAHGVLSVPGPAVLSILHGLPTAGGGDPADGELTTPTGAALLATVVDEFGVLPNGRILANGVGAGTRELADRPNVLRTVLVEAPQAPTAAGDTPPAASDRVTASETRPGADAGRSEPVDLLEANIDDLTPEMLAHAAETLRDAGALDVWFTNALMKKGRPGVVLHALVRGGDRDAVAAAVFRETSTFGIRVQAVERLYLDERRETIAVGGHDVRVRLGYLDGRLVTAAPEYEDCAAAARVAGLTVKEVYETAQGLARRRFAAG